ncbi:MAG: DUF308 domain-containing protein [Oscillospiraceae bacterium]
MQTSRRFKITFAIISITYVLLGLLFIWNPGFMWQFIFYLLACIAVLLGLIRVSVYFIKNTTEKATRNDLPFGALLVALGIFLFTKPSILVELLPILVGFAILYDSVVKLQTSLELKSAGFKPWWSILILSLITTVLALLLIVNPFASDVDGNLLRYYFAGVIIGDGALNLLTLLFAVITSATAHRKAAKAEKLAEKEQKEQSLKAAEDQKEAEKANVEEAPTLQAEEPAQQEAALGETDPVPSAEDAGSGTHE